VGGLVEHRNTDLVGEVVFVIGVPGEVGFE
jgi:hypothetical protein